jgi:DNA repair exonuclease SbcCD ATPase subunit
MFRKIGIAALAVAGGLLLVSWAGLGSYVSTAWNNVRSSMKRQVPLEFEIQRVRNQVAQLIPDMKKNFRAVAEQEVAVEDLKRELADRRVTLQQQKDNIRTMARDLESGVTPLVYDGQAYDVERVKAKLEHDFASYLTAEAELKAKQQLLDSRQQALDAAKQQLASIRQQKEQLELQVAELEAKLQTVRLAQTRSQWHIDDSKLGQCKAAIADIRHRLDVEVRQTELEGQFASDAIPVHKKAKSVKELTGAVDAYFNNGQAKNVASSRK